MSEYSAGKFSITNTNWPANPRFANFSDFLGVSVKRDSRGASWPYKRKTMDKINELFTWGKIKSKSQDLDKIKQEIFSLKRKVGTNFTGETLVDQLYQNIFFDSKLRITDKDRSLHEVREADILKEVTRQGEELLLDSSVEKTPEKSQVSKIKQLSKTPIIKPSGFDSGIKIGKTKTPDIVQEEMKL